MEAGKEFLENSIDHCLPMDHYEDDLSLYGSDFDIDANSYLNNGDASVLPVQEEQNPEKKSNNQLEDEQSDLQLYLNDKEEEYNDPDFDEDIPPISQIILSEKVKGSFMRLSKDSQED